MKMRIFTSMAAIAFAAMSASAAVDVELSIVAGRSDISYSGYEDGVFKYVSGGDDTRPIDGEGNPVGDFGNTIFGLSKFELPAPGRYVLAFDYKIDVDNFFNWLRARRTWDDGTSISTEADAINVPFVVADDWTTYYVPLIDTNVWDWVSESWQGEDNKYQPYLILDQDSNGKVGPFSLEIKNCRVLSNEEAVAEVFATPGDQKEEFYNFHGLLSEFDEAEGFSYYYIPENGLMEGEQGIIGTKNRLIPINPANKYLTFEYNSSDTFDMHVMRVMEDSELYAVPVGDIHIEGREDFGMDLADEANWNTASIDLSDIINNEGFGKDFGSKHYLWIQCYDAPNFAMFYVKNPRWSSVGANSVQTVEVAAGETVIYNLQGQKVAKAENGIFIKVENGRSSKVAVK